MILHRSGIVAQNAFHDLHQLPWTNFNAGLFPDLAHHAVAYRFAELKHTAGQAPGTLHGLFPPLDQQDTAFRDDHCSDADDRALWIIALVESSFGFASHFRDLPNSSLKTV